MEKKKYVLKSDNLEQEKSADGTENSEHVFDMIDRAEMCLSNIQDNTDLCMNIYKLSKQTLSEDEIDAMQLLCEENISIEQSAGEIAMQLEIVKGNIDKHLKVTESKVEEILKQILILELHSKEIAEKMLKNK